MKLFPSNYINGQIKYLRSTSICEYDMKSAGMSILKAKKLLTQEQINELEALPKEERNIRIGRLEQANEHIMREKNLGFKEYVTRFIVENRIPVECILTIKKDAVFLINQNPQILEFDEYVKFELKNQYTSYCNLSGKEFYYNGLLNILDTKGLGKEIAEKNKNSLLRDISDLLGYVECFDKKYMFEKLKEYRSLYLNRKLPLESYRDLETGAYLYGEYQVDIITENELKDIDIRNNFIKYIHELIKAIL